MVASGFIPDQIDAILPRLRIAVSGQIGQLSE
jgi:hypothetical protein